MNNLKDLMLNAVIGLILIVGATFMFNSWMVNNEGALEAMNFKTEQQQQQVVDAVVEVKSAYNEHNAMVQEVAKIADTPASDLVR